MRIKLVVIIGARPQFIKHFPFEKAAEGRVDLITIHTGQHYDENMSAVFFEQFGMKKPSYQLEIGSGNHGLQTGRMMIEIEEIILKEKPNGVVVYGDTNSTLAGGLVASKLHIPIFHIEAGLRSNNKEMPEEINRVLTDHISDLLFVPSKTSIENLNKEGITQGVFEVGDIMKDLVHYVLNQDLIEKIEPANNLGQYYYATIHRPYNTDSRIRLLKILETFNKLDNVVVFSIHPRTRNLAKQYKIELNDYKNIKFIDPQSYFSNFSFLKKSLALITDSGGMQKEAYWLEKRCITLRKETEWTETLKFNANKLVFKELSQIQEELNSVHSSWDEDLYGSGNSADKIVNSIISYFKK